MPDLANCPKCGRLYVQNLSGICDVCKKEEQKLFEKVYEYIRRRENRSAGIAQIVEHTGVDEDIIMRFVKEGRLRVSQFPNLGYPCEKCGSHIQRGKLCANCTTNIQTDLEKHNYEEDRRKKKAEEEKKSHTYYTFDPNK